MPLDLLVFDKHYHQTKTKEEGNYCMVIPIGSNLVFGVICFVSLSAVLLQGIIEKPVVKFFTYFMRFLLFCCKLF